MLEIKYGANLAIPGGPQFSASNQVLQVEVYKHFSITLTPETATSSIEDITLKDPKELNLLAVRATGTLAKGSSTKVQYKVEDVSASSGSGSESGAGSGSGTSTVDWKDLDAPLLILGTWVKSVLQKDVKISFQLVKDESKPEFSKDVFQIEIIIGWAEAT